MAQEEGWLLGGVGVGGWGALLVGAAAGSAVLPSGGAVGLAVVLAGACCWLSVRLPLGVTPGLAWIRIIEHGFFTVG